MKKWIPLIIIMAVVALVLFTDVGWQAMTMVAAGVSGLGKLILGRLGGRADEIAQKHEVVRAREREYQQGLQANIRIQEQEILELEGRLGGLDARLSELGRRREQIGADIASMSESELKAAGRHYFGS